MCGATRVRIRCPISFWGLSPRVWGNQQVPMPLALRPRPIPTCVGQPSRAAHGCRLSKAYPHVCGATAHIVFFE